MPVTAFGSGILIGTFGLVMSRDQKSRFRVHGYGFILGGILVIVGGAPTTITNRIFVNGEGVKGRTGSIWFAPHVFDIRFADIAHIRMEVELDRGRFGQRETNYNLMFEDKIGRQTRVDVDGLMREACPEIENNARRLNIDVRLDPN